MLATIRCFPLLAPNLVVLAGLALLFSACNKAAPPPVAGSEVKVFGGQEAGPSDAISWSTVAIAKKKGGCSGTLIDTRLVVTAAHCFHRKNINMTDFEVIFGTNIKGSEDLPKIKGRHFVHENWHDGGEFDIALVYLDQPAPKGFKPVERLKAGDSLKFNEPIIVAGYGTSVAPKEGDHFGILRFTDQTIDDLPSTQDFWFGWQAKKTHRIVGSPGDSGGSVYVKRGFFTKSLVLAGIFKAGSTWTGSATDIRKYDDWITKTSARAKAAADAPKPRCR